MRRLQTRVMRLVEFRKYLLAGAAATGSLFATLAAGAQTTTAFEGYNPGDPLGSAARELVRLVRQQCDVSQERVVVGVASLPIEQQTLTRDQGNNIMAQVHAAFSRLPNVRVIDFKDVGAMEELRTVGLTSGPNAGNVEQIMRQAEVRVQATGQKVGRNIRFQLRGTHRDRQDCDVSTPPVELSAQLVGEVFSSTEVVFGNMARDLWRRSRDVTFVGMSASSGGGGGVDPFLSEYFLRQMKLAVSKNKDDNADIRNTELVVLPRREASLQQGQRWDTEVYVEPMMNGYKLIIESNKANTTTISHEGLIQAADLPSQRKADLVRQASMIRAPAPPPRGAGTARAARAPGDAAVLSITGAPTRVQDSVDDQTGEQRYAFQLFRESFVEFEVVRLNGRQISFKPELFGANGMPVDGFPPGTARINLRRYRLPAGQYELRVTPEERGRHDFVLATRAASTSSMLEFEPTGRLTRRFNDWFAGERMLPPGPGGQPGKICYAYTQAMEVSPAGWREQRPYIWIAINGDPKIQEIAHFIDDATRYDRDAGVKVNFEDQGGAFRPLGVKAIKRGQSAWFEPAATNARGDAILDRESVRAYTQGHSIVVSGRTAEGKPAEVRYSLVGYRGAINAAALNCGRADLAQDLVWRR
jgi:hypothetical protein